MRGDSEGSVGSQEPIAVFADTVLARCEGLVRTVSDAAYAAASLYMNSATIGQHVRHLVDHFRAIADRDEGAIAYDRRARGVPMETDRTAALHEIDRLRDFLRRLNPSAMDEPVRVRIAIDREGGESEVGSTVGRELAFAAHHAVHHEAMLGVMARELGVPLPGGGFGYAPATPMPGPVN